MPYSFISGINDPAFGKSEAKIITYLEDANLAAEEKSMIPVLFPEVQANDFAQAYGGDTMIGGFIPGKENSNYTQTSGQSDWIKTVFNDIEWKREFPITKMATEDTKVGLGKRPSKALMRAFHNTLEQYAADYFINAISTTQTFKGMVFDISGGDTKALFATDHPDKIGGTTQSNRYSEAAITPAVLTKQKILMQQAKVASPDGGDLVNVTPDTIILPAANAYDSVQIQTVFEMLNGDGNPGSPNLKGNYHFGTWDVVQWKFLGAPTGIADSSSWYMLADMEYVMDFKPYMLQKRVDLTMRSYIDEANDSAIYKGRSRHVISTSSDWKGIAINLPLA